MTKSLFREVEGRETLSGKSVGEIQLLSDVTVDCRPRPFFCAESDISIHYRDAMTAGFFQPLPPTTFMVDKALSHCGKF